MCEQADIMLDKAEAGTVTPPQSAALMISGARLAYVRNTCGARVAVDKAIVCADQARELQAYAASEGVPRGENRDTTINQALSLYKNAGCEPALQVE